MKRIHIECGNVITEECSKNAHKELGISYDDTWRCVEKSFSSSDWSKFSTKNEMIEEEILYWKAYGSGILPSIVINNITYRGQIEKLEVFNALCAGFKNSPDICKETLGIVTPDALTRFKNSFSKSSLTTNSIILIVVAVLFINIAIVYCYRRKAKREMHDHM